MHTSAEDCDCTQNMDQLALHFLVDIYGVHANVAVPYLMETIWKNLRGSNSAKVLFKVTAKVATDHMSSSVQQLIDGDSLVPSSSRRRTALMSYGHFLPPAALGEGCRA